MTLFLPGMTLVIDKDKKEVRWNANPPPTLSYQTHKFSILDAIETASNLIGTDYTREHETVICGSNARAILIVLPHMLLANLTAEGLMPREGEFGLVGTIGARKIYWTQDMEAVDTIVLSNPREKATVRLVYGQDS